MSRETYTKIEAPDTHEAKEMLNICFGKDSSLRKELLIDNDGVESSYMSDETSVPKKTTKASSKKKAAKKAAKKKVTKKKTAKKVAKKTKKTSTRAR